MLGATIKGLQLNAQNVGAARELVAKFIDHREFAIQKKVYMLILALMKKSGASSLADAVNIYKWIEGTKQPMAKVGRIRVVAAIIDIMVRTNEAGKLDLGPDVETLINAILPELIICVKAQHKKTCDEALAAAINLSRIMVSKAALMGLVKKLLAGLAGKSVEFRVGTIVLIGRLLYEHHEELSPEFTMEVSNLIVILLKESDVKVVKAAMNYIKVLVSVLPKERVEGYIDVLANGLLVWTGKYKAEFRLKIRYILKKMIKKTSAELVKAKVVGADKPLIEYICKSIKRDRNAKKKSKKEEDKKQKGAGEAKKYEKIVKDGDEEENEEEDSDEEMAEGMKGAQESESESEDSLFSDSDNEAIPVISAEEEGKKTEKQEKTELLEDRIERMFKAPESELDTHFFQGAKRTGKGQKGEEVAKPLDKSVYVSKESGKLVVNDEDEDKEDADKKAKPKAQKKPGERSKKRSLKDTLLGGEDVVSDEEPSGRKRKAVEEKGEVKAEKVKKQREPGKKKNKKLEGHIEVHSGEEYKSKAGKGDVWKKGQKFEPFAYIRFNPKVRVMRDCVDDEPQAEEAGTQEFRKVHHSAQGGQQGGREHPQGRQGRQER